MSTSEEFSENATRLAKVNASLAANARMNCGTHLDPRRENLIDHSIQNRQRLIEWFAARHIVIEMADSVYRAGGLAGKCKG